ncbi:hypothetical protein TRFO_12778 [Tritrichomonas foetus]|uniref:Uncharacterized protein n=1 Tax=Tritrichomonas foetus TaxID=1144522 RepID=A0A1J4L4Q6_9EUKA|nr:hypothetical protein TRFO_12778 [Tritrichomonas foetus]|eukprot:OHT16909.1 hypothetical protein TRFO_12778 [Tritrichomonas foetus]
MFSDAVDHCNSTFSRNNGQIVKSIFKGKSCKFKNDNLSANSKFDRDDHHFVVPSSNQQLSINSSIKNEKDTENIHKYKQKNKELKTKLKILIKNMNDQELKFKQQIKNEKESFELHLLDIQNQNTVLKNKNTELKQKYQISSKMEKEFETKFFVIDQRLSQLFSCVSIYFQKEISSIDDIMNIFTKKIKGNKMEATNINTCYKNDLFQAKEKYSEKLKILQNKENKKEQKNQERLCLNNAQSIIVIREANIHNNNDQKSQVSSPSPAKKESKKKKYKKSTNNCNTVLNTNPSSIPTHIPHLLQIHQTPQIYVNNNSSYSESILSDEFLLDSDLDYKRNIIPPTQQFFVNQKMDMSPNIVKTHFELMFNANVFSVKPKKFKDKESQHHLQFSGIIHETLGPFENKLNEMKENNNFTLKTQNEKIPMEATKHESINVKQTEITNKEIIPNKIKQTIQQEEIYVVDPKENQKNEIPESSEEINFKFSSDSLYSLSCDLKSHTGNKNHIKARIEQIRKNVEDTIENYYDEYQRIMKEYDNSSESEELHPPFKDKYDEFRFYVRNCIFYSKGIQTDPLKFDISNECNFVKKNFSTFIIFDHTSPILDNTKSRKEIAQKHKNIISKNFEIFTNFEQNIVPIMDSKINNPSKKYIIDKLLQIENLQYFDIFPVIKTRTLQISGFTCHEQDLDNSSRANYYENHVFCRKVFEIVDIFNRNTEIDDLKDEINLIRKENENYIKEIKEFTNKKNHFNNELRQLFLKDVHTQKIIDFESQSDFNNSIHVLHQIFDYFNQQNTQFDRTKDILIQIIQYLKNEQFHLEQILSDESLQTEFLTEISNCIDRSSKAQIYQNKLTEKDNILKTIKDQLNMATIELEKSKKNAEMQRKEMIIDSLKVKIDDIQNENLFLKQELIKKRQDFDIIQTMTPNTQFQAKREKSFKEYENLISKLQAQCNQQKMAIQAISNKVDST